MNNERSYEVCELLLKFQFSESESNENMLNAEFPYMYKHKGT